MRNLPLPTPETRVCLTLREIGVYKDGEWDSLMDVFLSPDAQWTVFTLFADHPVLSQYFGVWMPDSSGNGCGTWVRLCDGDAEFFGVPEFGVYHGDDDCLTCTCSVCHNGTN